MQHSERPNDQAKITQAPGHPNRRQFLAASSAAVALSLTSCMNSPEQLPEDTHSPHAPHGAEHKHAHVEKPITVFTAEEVQAGLPGRTEIADASEVEEECIDGRCKEAVAGVPGGSIGTVEVEATTIQKLTGKRPTREQIRAYLKLRPRIKLHTDSHKMESLATDVATDPQLKAAMERITLPVMLDKGTGDQTLNRRFAVLVRKNFGCGFFANMMKDPQAFGVDAGLAEDIVEEALLLMWEEADATSKSKVEVKVLEGDHGEGAVAAVNMPEGVKGDDAKVALVTPDHDGKQVFVYTPQFAQYKFGKDLPLWEQALGQKLDPEQFAKLAAETLDRQTNEIAGRLAKGRHLMSATIDPKDAKHPTVKDLATIGAN